MPTNDTVTVQLDATQLMMLAYWGLLALGGVLLVVGFAAESNGKFGYLIASCFFGIAARVVQAEHHHRAGRANAAAQGA